MESIAIISAVEPDVISGLASIRSNHALALSGTNS